jgi:hypothetical protein
MKEEDKTMTTNRYFRFPIQVSFVFVIGVFFSMHLSAEIITLTPLINPGAELGTKEGWEHSMMNDFSVVSGPRSYNGVTLNATEGDNWFMEQESSTWTGHQYSFLVLWISQTMDVSEIKTFQLLQYSADFQWSGYSSSGSINASYALFCKFYDKNSVYFAYDSVFERYYGEPGTVMHIDQICTTVPEGTTKIEIGAAVNGDTYNSGTILAGVDNFSFSVTGDTILVPEPSSTLMTLSGCIVAFLSFIRFIVRNKKFLQFRY